MVRSTSLLRDAPGGHYSLGRTQMAFWGLLVFLGWLAVWVLTQMLEYIPNQTLMLMGISAVTGLAAAFIGQPPADRLATLKAEADALRAKPAASPPVALTPAEQVRLAEIDQDLARVQAFNARPAAFWRDLCDDGNGPSFQRVQVVAWTLALGVVFVFSIASTMAMPEFSQTLLLLMGLSNGTYLGFKFSEKA